MENDFHNPTAPGRKRVGVGPGRPGQLRPRPAAARSRARVHAGLRGTSRAPGSADQIQGIGAIILEATGGRVRRVQAGGVVMPGSEAGSDPPLLQMTGISKSYFGVRVLNEVDLDCRAGEVHAVVGENGAGKSTLMKILAAATQPDAGAISLDGAEFRFTHPDRAQRQGISIMYQEFTLLPE